MILIYGLVGYLCWIFGQEAIKTNNIYTINHMNFNIKLMTIAVKGILSIGVGLIS
jgi:hypothetical protein